MKILFLCGVFAKENEQEIISHAKAPIEYSANVFQEKLISGFKKITPEFEVLSAPFIGSYPNRSNLMYFNGFEESQNEYKYVHFLNIWGLRNFSRARALKKAIRDFIRLDDDEKLIVVYSPHTPFLQAAAFAKKKDPRIKINLVIPDLPQYMNLNAKISLAYRVCKKFDIRLFNKLNRKMDTYVLLTEAMKEKVDIENKRYTVVEGIVRSDAFEEAAKKKRLVERDSECKYIVYTGKMQEKFGVKNLVDEFCKCSDSSYKLILCGKGDLDLYIQEKAQSDSRIVALGQVTPQVANEWVMKADVLVNPRQNNEEYTKYSFPSKVIEYLLSGNPVVCYKLDGMPNEYADFVHFVKPNGSIMATIDSAMGSTKSRLFEKYAKSRLSDIGIAKRIIDYSFDSRELEQDV